MALKALDIFKLLPKTNCKDCGCPTCLAFAMKLAQKQATLDQCPHVTDASKAALEGASAPPVRLIKIGTGADALEIGNETVLFRHEETFYHPPGIGIVIPDNLDEAALASWKYVRAEKSAPSISRCMALKRMIPEASMMPTSRTPEDSSSWALRVR